VTPTKESSTTDTVKKESSREAAEEVTTTETFSRKCSEVAAAVKQDPRRARVSNTPLK